MVRIRKNTKQKEFRVSNLTHFYQTRYLQAKNSDLSFLVTAKEGLEVHESNHKIFYDEDHLF
jgi:hypothetical protein